MLYAELKGTVLTDKERDMFEIMRRTKQGDLLSILLFNTVLQMAFENVVECWQKTKGMGIRLGVSLSDCFTHQCFADDVHLFSFSLVQLPKMMCDFKQSTESAGLDIDPGKTNISRQKVQTKAISGYEQHRSWDVICAWECDMSWANKYVSATGKAEITNSNQSLSSIVLQIQTRVGIKIVLLVTQTPLIQHEGSRRRWATSLELWHHQKNTKDWYDQLNAKCFASTFKQRENTEIKLGPARKRETRKMKK